MQRGGRMNRIFLLLLTLLVAGAAYFRIAQSAMNRSLEWEMQGMRREKLNVHDENRQLLSEIAKLSNPDRIAGIAERVLSMDQADVEDLLIVIEERGVGE